MITLSCLFVLLVASQVVSSQGPPPPPPPHHINNKCHGPPPNVENPELCCEMVPMFGEEELESCGFKKFGENGENKRGGPPDCSKPICLLKKKGLIDEEGNIKFPEVSEYLYSWAGDSFKDAADTAKDVCLADGKVPGPPQICEPARLMHCVGGAIFANCPADKWQQTDNCKTLKEHMAECSPQERH